MGNALGWAIALVVLASHAWMLDRYAVNVPTADDFTQLLAVPGYVEHTPGGIAGKTAYLFSLSVEHRIFTMRAMAWAQSVLLGGFDFRGLIFLGNALALGAGALVLWQAPPAWRGRFAPIVALLLASPTNWFAQYWPTGATQHLALVAYTLAALWCAQRPGPAWGAVGTLLATGAALTAANGLMAFPAAAVQLAASGRRRAAAGWVVVGIALGAAYFIGYAMPEGRPSVLEGLRHPVQLFGWFLMALGSMSAQLAGGTALPMALGAILVATWLWLILSVRCAPPPLLLGWTLFLLASAAAITVGRAPLGVDALLNSRYRVYSEFVVIIGIVAILRQLHAAGRMRVGAWLIGLLLPLALVWAWKSWDANMADLVGFSLQRRNGLDHYVATGGHGRYGDFPPQDFGDFILARTRSAGQYLPARDATPAAQLIEAPAPPGTRPRFVDAQRPFAHAGALSVHGQSLAWQPRIVLWLGGESVDYRGTPQQQRIFDPLLGSGRVGFWGTWILAGVAPGRYRIGYGEKEFGDDAVFWTDDWIEVR